MYCSAIGGGLAEARTPTTPPLPTPGQYLWLPVAASKLALTLTLDLNPNLHPHHHYPTPGRYLWLPVAPSKLARHGLQDALGPALAFLSHHIALGRRVLVHDDQGERH